jgi:hypothetical protein
MRRGGRMARCLVGALRLLTGDAPTRTRKEATPGPCLPATKTRPTPPAVAFPLARLLLLHLPPRNHPSNLYNNNHISIDKWKHTQLCSRRTPVGLLKNFRPVRAECHLPSHQESKLILFQLRNKIRQTGHHHKPQRLPWQISVAVHERFMPEPR